MSLRTRLIAGLLTLAALGLLTLAGVTYAEQRSFLLQRVDQQAAAAESYVSTKLDELGANVSQTAQRGPGGFGLPAPRGDGGGGGGGGGGPGGPPVIDLPPGTYGQRRDANGKALKPPYLSSFGQKVIVPNLPAKMPLGQAITVGSVGSSGVRFRALATRTRDEPGTTIVAIPLRDVDQTLHRLLIVEALVIAAVLGALALLAWWLVRLGLRPLDRIGETAGAIASGDLSRRVSPATKRTEVGRLGLALNSMLAQIEKAFAERQASEDRLRRFLADASHELRTPLASIRGYAELFRMGAAREPDKAERSMQRIEEEAKRMGTLVEDLLTLARLDQLPEAARKPVDLRTLTTDAADDARAAAPERRIDVVDGPAVRVIGDSSQLRQVVGNLVRNALVHTPAGTAIELRVATEGQRATLEVRDHGPGLPTDDAGALFERFWRSDPGRGRGAAGAGLGLSIVAAIVTAHGGTVTAENAADGGARFLVSLPLAQLPAAAPEPQPLPSR